MTGNEQRENNEYMLEWYVKEPYSQYMRRFFKTLWEARCYADNFDHHVDDVRIYQLSEILKEKDEKKIQDIY